MRPRSQRGATDAEFAEQLDEATEGRVHTDTGLWSALEELLYQIALAANGGRATASLVADAQQMWEAGPQPEDPPVTRNP